jgi:hypothetical protein
MAESGISGRRLGVEWSKGCDSPIKLESVSRGEKVNTNLAIHSDIGWVLESSTSSKMERMRRW